MFYGCMPAAIGPNTEILVELIHNRGTQYVSIRYTERLAEAGIEPSVGSVGDSYDNALAETINGLYKAEVIHRCEPRRDCRRPFGLSHATMAYSLDCA